MGRVFCANYLKKLKSIVTMMMMLSVEIRASGQQITCNTCDK